MARNLLTSYGAENFVLVEDYKMKCNSIDVGQPEVGVLLSNDVAAIQTVTWKRGLLDESLRFKYVGMDYDTAQACANTMRSTFTYSKPTWQYGAYADAGQMLVGWHKGANGYALDSSIAVVKTSNGCMYDVVVDAHAEIENYTNGGDAVDMTTKPLQTRLNYIPGYSSSPTLTGSHFNAAGPRNIKIVSAPTRTTKFDLVAEDLYTTSVSSTSEISVVQDNWYKATTDFYATVRYEGMTEAACKALYGSLNQFNSSGWYLSSNPWEISAWVTSSTSATTQLSIAWVQNPNVTSWQCLNDYVAAEDESGMFTAELHLHAQETTMLTRPASYPTPSWPSMWDNIPGLDSYLL